MALAHLALNRKGGVTRERLIAALWGEDAPAGHAQALNVVLSKLRRALGPEVIENAGERAVQLTPAATVDLDGAQPALDEAFAARDRGDWPAVVEAAGRVAELADAGLLPGYEAPWLEDPRRRLEELGLQARELRGDAGLAVGGAELAPAERAAQELVELAPYRESGYLLLMRVREAQGNLVEALRVHERLRTLLRDELGVSPGPQVQAEFERMLKAERAEPEPAALAPPPPPAADADGHAFFATRSGAAFVGRRGELDRLREYFERATEGNRQLVLLEGEPGIGKTRLAMEFMEACEAEGSLALYGRCDAETLVPYQPFVEALRRYVSRAPEQAGAWRAQYGAELGRVIPELAGAGDTPGGPEEEERYRLFDAVSEVLNDIARHQPVVLVLDDLHWADKPTLLMLRQMVRAAGESPLLIVATIRDTERPTALVDMLVQLRREHYFDRIELTGLDEEDATVLIGEFGPQGIPEHVNRTLWEETKGNPFFLEEMVRHLGNTSPGGNGSAWPLELPEGIREVIGRRLATLSERAGQLLTIAAVMGREFRVEVLEAVSDLDEDELDEVIEEAVAAHVIAEVPNLYGRCSFTHALIRQTLYDGLTATRRARLHLRVAEAIELLAGGWDDPPLATLTHHFSLAPPQRGAAKTVEYAERAAERALGVLAYEEAARLYKLAIDALDQAPSDPALTCRLLLACGNAQNKAGDTLEAQETFRRAADTARALGSSQLLASAALGYGMPGQMAGGIVDDALVALLEEALDAVGDDEPALRARLVARLAIELSFSEAGERRAQLSSEAVELAREVGDPRGLGFALVARHWSLWGPGNVQERLEAANDLLGLAESSGDERLAIAGHRWRMIDLLELGDIDSADIEMDAFAKIAERRRRVSDTLYVHIYRAMRLLLAGEFDAAEAEGYAAVTLGNRVQDPNTGNATLLQACTLRRERGRLERLEAPVRAYAERFAAIPGWVCVLAHLLAETDRHDEAREILDAFAADGFRGVPLDGIWLGAVAYLAETAAALGDADARPGAARPARAVRRPQRGGRLGVDLHGLGGAPPRPARRPARPPQGGDRLLRDRAGHERADARPAVGGAHADRAGARAGRSRRRAASARPSCSRPGSPRLSGSACPA